MSTESNVSKKLLTVTLSEFIVRKSTRWHSWRYGWLDIGVVDDVEYSYTILSIRTVDPLLQDEASMLSRATE